MADIIGNSRGYKQSVKKWLGGIIFTSSLFLSSIMGFIVLSPIYMTAFLLKLHCAQWIFDTLMSTWFAFLVAAYELLYGVRIVIQGDVTAMNKNRCSLIVMNHRTRLDWLFYFAVQARYASLRRLKICLKNELRHIPGVGWAMQAAKFLFLHRKWNSDRERIVEYLSHFNSLTYAPQLLFFPEGTDFRSLSRQRSKEYAEKNSLNDYDHVLHPRTLGFTALVGHMKQYNKLDQIVNVTVAYPENVLQRETDLITGNIPRVIVFTVDCYDIDTVPTDNDGLLSRWIEDRWRIKEDFLKEFYCYRDYNAQNGYSEEQNLEIERDLKVYLIGSLVFWSMLSMCTLYWLVFFPWFRLCFLWSVPVCVIVSTVIGFDNLFTILTPLPDTE
ncbi:lysocardiolipin acyltransferase 1-like [Mya arenaria]|uniref:lysocardiolipin acyltransferase 1-like n=1 Tax=Mya arenaria TaxID=6604 RepID=UPI0022E59884|nr:lysocardiolipin acyltransferase 1-like [Mya arenaria]